MLELKLSAGPPLSVEKMIRVSASMPVRSSVAVTLATPSSSAFTCGQLFQCSSAQLLFQH